MDELKKLNEKIGLVTREKNKYLKIFESLPNPVILANEKNQFEYMNHAAAILFNDQSTCGARYRYQVVDGMDFAAVKLPGEAEVAGQECIVFLRPERIGDAELNMLFLLDMVERFA